MSESLKLRIKLMFYQTVQFRMLEKKEVDWVEIVDKVKNELKEIDEVDNNKLNDTITSLLDESYFTKAIEEIKIDYDFCFGDLK